MSQHVFYSDLDIINGKGVLVTGHGKGIVDKNPLVNGKYVVNDMVRLIYENHNLLGYQGYVDNSDDNFTKVEYALYFYEKDELDQPLFPTKITVENFLLLSKHNIELGESISNMFTRSKARSSITAYEEYQIILNQATDILYYSIPFTINENDRVAFINSAVK